MRNKSCFLIVPFLLSVITISTPSKAQHIVYPFLSASSLSSTTVAEAEELEWEWEVKNRSDRNYYNYYLQSVSYKSQGNIIWQYSLPDRITSHAFWITKEPTDVSNYYGFPFLIGSIFTDKTVVIADDSGLLVLDKQTGQVLFNQSAESSSDSFFVDQGTATLTTASQNCEAEADGGKFVAECGKYIIYFNGYNLWVLNSSGEILDSANYRYQDHNIKTDESLSYHIKISLKTVTVDIRGFVLNAQKTAS